MPAVVLAEWWTANPRQFLVLKTVTVEPTTEEIAKLAGRARAAIKQASAIDAVVMASAALQGGIVCTSDVNDFSRLRDGFFRAVRVVQV